MKKLLLASIAVASGLFASAQYVISANKAPLAGDFDFNTIDTLPTVTKGGSGAGQSWDLSAIQAHVDNFGAWGNPSSSAYASEFPDADLLLEDAANGESFYSKANSRLTWIGVVFDIGTGPQPVRLRNPGVFFNYPAEFGDSYKDTASFRVSFPIGQEFGGFQIDSGRYTFEQIRDVNFDAHGSLITPAGIFPSSLRERTYTIQNDKLEICVKFSPLLPCQYTDVSTLDPSFAPVPDSSVTYAWYGPESSSLLASITYNSTEDTVRLASFNNDPTFTGISETTVVKGNIFPNPAKNTLMIKGVTAPSVLTITDLTGRVVYSAQNFSGGRVDVTTLEAGHYIVSIENGTIRTTEKVQILE